MVGKLIFNYLKGGESCCWSDPMAEADKLILSVVEVMAEGIDRIDLLLVGCLRENRVVVEKIPLELRSRWHI